MRLKNYTDFTDTEVRELINLVRPPGIAKFEVRVQNFRDGAFFGRGMAYTEGTSVTRHPVVIISIPRKERYARYITEKEYGKGYLGGITLGGRKETLLFILAHELRHLWQGKVRKGRRVWGSKGVFSERDADAYALSKLRKYRRGEL